MLFLFFMYATIIWGRPKAVKLKSMSIDLIRKSRSVFNANLMNLTCFHCCYFFFASLQRRKNVTQKVFPVNCIVRMSRIRKVDRLIAQNRSAMWLYRSDDLLYSLLSDAITLEVSICVWGRLVSAFNVAFKRSFPSLGLSTINLNLDLLQLFWQHLALVPWSTRAWSLASILNLNVTLNVTMFYWHWHRPHEWHSFSFKCISSF